MPKLKNLSGEDVIKIFENFGFSVIAQKGSHVKLRRFVDRNIKQTLTIPNHKELDKGTVVAIYNQAMRYISESELREHFYTK
ncbi:type II toxin-antitoxin system HicA family toxin [Patescibacteria group bacterium]|nr:type II toxin-antitoxin system HicA family toxin [Patescibacteria group bacterium]MBU2633555.1 type II toxin-antitoxin system HicA family toxin [Patescibacteria group bacterium]